MLGVETCHWVPSSRSSTGQRSTPQMRRHPPFFLLEPQTGESPSFPSSMEQRSQTTPSHSVALNTTPGATSWLMAPSIKRESALPSCTVSPSKKGPTSSQKLTKDSAAITWHPMPWPARHYAKGSTDPRLCPMRRNSSTPTKDANGWGTGATGP